MFNLKALAASALIAVSSFGAIAPANAAATDCWIVGNHHTASRNAFRCNVNRRINANGHIVWDVTHNQLNGASFTVVFWTDETADVIFTDGTANVHVPAYTDSDGDQRIVLGDMEFIISI
jgi:hypothetical protein